MEPWDRDQHLQGSLGLTKHIERFGVGLLELHGDHPAGIASGTCVQIDQTFLIATAAHVLAGTELDNLFVVPAGGPHGREDRVPFIRSGFAGGGTRDGVDVAYLQVQERDLLRLGKQFLPHVRIAQIGPPRGRALTVWGAPAGLIDVERFQRTKNLIVRFEAVTSAHVTPEFEGADPAIDIALDYRRSEPSLRADGERATLPAGPGFSGGGIWTPGFDESALWSPEAARLVGIQHAWNEVVGYMRGTQIRHWLRLVREDFPELRSTLEGI